MQPDDENVTEPDALLTVTVNDVAAVPLTVREAGVIFICPELLEVALMVPVPVTFVRFTLTAAEPLLTIVTELGAFNRQGGGVGVGVGVGDGLTVGVGEGFAVGVGVGVGVGVEFGFDVGVGVGVGLAPAPGLAPGDGDGDG